MMTTTSSTSSNTGSTTTGLPTECDPLALMSGQSLDATCGIFVNPAGPSGDGSQAMPYATLAEALTNNPDNQPIFVCATSDSLDEPVTLSGTERLVGGLDCVTWQASATKTAWTSAVNTIPLTLDGTSGAHVQGFAITARDAMGFDAGTLDGNDSIAIVADGATATLLQVDVVAGAGGVGGDGEDQMGQAPGRQSDAMAFDGNDGGGCGMSAGGTAKEYLLCPTGGATEGGKGGDGGSSSGGNASAGVSGSPDPLLGEPNGGAGAGQDGTVGWDCSLNDGNGENGHPGPLGEAGTAGATMATLAPAALVGAAAGDGAVGIIGQGGGGGGGRKGNGASGCGGGISGPSGGSGGAGGCGGLAGGGAGQGGASVALISLTSTLVLTDVTLRAGAGGSGGAGGDGQAGGNGGLGAPSAGAGCTGGSGGAGGNGGPGGGGAGGASIGIAFTGAAPDISDDAIIVAAAAAAGGDGGNANSSANNGAAGLTSKKQMF
jgi:hypothetical protein